MWPLRIEADAHVGTEPAGEVLAHHQMHTAAAADHRSFRSDALLRGAVHAIQLAGATHLDPLDLLIQQAALACQAADLPEKALVTADIQAGADGR